MHVVRHILDLIPPWAKPVLLGLALGYALWKAIMSASVNAIWKWYYARFDKATLLILPMETTKLPDIARLRKKNEQKTLHSLRRLREQDLAQALHVDDFPDDYLWKKLPPVTASQF